ncbi:MAG: hypothetical protein U0K28_08975 [Prevotellamassilia sp.]|nr:hypothetical protein [Prevotellamassilia sp.]
MNKLPVSFLLIFRKKSRFFKEQAAYFSEDYLPHPTPLFSLLPFPFLPFSSFLQAGVDKKSGKRECHVDFFVTLRKNYLFVRKKLPKEE